MPPWAFLFSRTLACLFGQLHFTRTMSRPHPLVHFRQTVACLRGRPRSSCTLSRLWAHQLFSYIEAHLCWCSLFPMDHFSGACFTTTGCYLTAYGRGFSTFFHCVFWDSCKVQIQATFFHFLRKRGRINEMLETLKPVHSLANCIFLDYFLLRLNWISRLKWFVAASKTSYTNSSWQSFSNSAITFLTTERARFYTDLPKIKSIVDYRFWRSNPSLAKYEMFRWLHLLKPVRRSCCIYVIFYCVSHLPLKNET